MTAPTADVTAPTALVVIPQSVNYFYNQAGRRIAEGLAALGWRTDIRGLGEWSGESYDWCLIANLTEVLVAHGDEDDGLSLVRRLRSRCGGTAVLGIDCVGTHWFRHLNYLADRAGIETVLDLGLYDQTEYLWPQYRRAYRFLFSGLTPTEVCTARSVCAADDTDARAFPWAFVGHGTYHRVALVDLLLQAVDPRGFVYVPTLAPYKEKGSPHLNQRQFEAVLHRTRYQVWCSHHEHFYMEPERFRTSLLTGGVPIKVVDSSAVLPPAAPFRYLMMEARDMPGRLTPELFARVRRQFCQDYMACPTLTHELARVLTDLGVWFGPTPRSSSVDTASPALRVA